MKIKVIIAALAIAATAIFSSQADARKISYRGFVDVAGGIPGNLAASTTHGIQWSPKVFTGLGGQVYYGLDDQGVGFDVYANFRMDFSTGKRWTPWFSLSPGYDINDEVGGFYGSVSGGARYAISNRVGLNMGLTFNYYGGIENSYWASDPCFMVGVKFGVDF